MIDVLITFRDRVEHLNILIPQIRSNLSDHEHRITVIEQLNEFVFYKSILYNVGIKHTVGDTIILTDVDYVPTDDATYLDDGVDLFLPIKRVRFIKLDGTARLIEDVPSGYRHFINSVDDNFFGGVLVFKRSAMNIVGGFNPLYMGWGLEDADIGRRALYHQLSIKRGNGTFLALEHTDNNPGSDNPYFRWNQELYHNFNNSVKHGMSNQIEVINISDDKSKLYNVDQWIEVMEAEVDD